MDVISSTAKMHAWAEAIRGAGKRIAFVPTMGFLHEGHLVLMREGKKRCEQLAVSIFVNPTQFGVGEDLDKYPRDMEGDQAKCLQEGVNVIFAPSALEMYPPLYQTFVDVEKVTQHLCGLSRPTHFRGVTTVVAKLFNLVKPHVAVFGEKDYQQLVTIRRMVKDLDFDLEIIGIPTVREPDGLAMSSRNKYLTPEQRTQALCLQASLHKAQALCQQGVRDSRSLIREAEKIISAQPSATIDYIKLCHPETLEDLDSIATEALMALAVRIGATRLIDNRILKP
jgi:pantoate--beta-alanine ligase